MRHKLLAALLAALPLTLLAQTGPAPETGLTVDYIMRDASWMGHFPDNLSWSYDGDRLYFNWNPENTPSDSLYWITPGGSEPMKADLEMRRNRPSRWSRIWNRRHDRFLFEDGGDLYIQPVKGSRIRLTETDEREQSPLWSADEQSVIYRVGDNLFKLPLKEGRITQLTHFAKEAPQGSSSKQLPPQEAWVAEEAVALSQVLQDNIARREARKAAIEKEAEPDPFTVYLGKESLWHLSLSGDENRAVFVTNRRPAPSRRSKVPDYVRESGYVEDRNAYAYVGANQSSYRLGIADFKQDTVYYVSPESLPGLEIDPMVSQGIKAADSTRSGESERSLRYSEPFWSPDRNQCVVDIYTQDHKDRWIVSLNLADAGVTVLDHQHDDAWIGGPGINRWRSSLGFMPDGKAIWFQSEESGWSHLYTVDLSTGRKQALTSGEFEVYQPQVSRDKKHWYFTANMKHPGIRHFYSMPLAGGPMTQLTVMDGGNEVSLSPDEKWLAYRWSDGNTPWELFIQQNQAGARPRQITHSASEAFKAYSWRMPEYVTFTARDGAAVHARLYRPAKQAITKPGVIFVHGAGYLQNAHQWWSDYFREFMFHNLLADAGYTVLDIDYRGSAGYGRDCRTAIYRHMGGKDLSDQVDGAHFLAETCGVSPRHIGIYGGSYGGFITLMAMFTEGGTFKAGAALRSVTDWAHYHHGYTSPILNTPVADSTAYRQSSPIYFAEGLKGALLMCHGMVDTNVHFQDIVRLTQRLIELGKKNWELAVYPVEGHGFTTPSAWTDEYSRIFRLFETQLKQP